MNWTYEYIKLFSAWPVILLIIVLLLIFHFKEEISKLINKIKSINKGGVDFSDQIRSQTELDTVIKNLESEKEQKEQQIERHRGEASELLKIASQLNSDIENLKLFLHYEKVYNLIFGGQINILINLKSKGGQDDLRNIVLIFNQAVQSSSWLVSYGFQSYLKFLVDMLLIEFINHEQIKITELGDGFLKYIDDRKYSIYKYG